MPLSPQSFWESRIHPGDKDRVLTRLKNCIKSGMECLWEEEYRFQKADGSYAYVHERGHVICSEGQVSRIIGSTQDVSEKVLLKRELEKQQSINQREITSAVLAAQERERMEIGRELHDNLNHILAVAQMYIKLAQRNEEKSGMYLEKSTGFIKDVIAEVRKISRNLLPADMGIVGFSDSIKMLISDFQSAHPSKSGFVPLKIDFVVDGVNLADLDEKLQLHIYRIIQEQLNNIFKHAHASHIGIKISGNKSEVILFIADNGRGYDVSKGSKGVGIRNIKSRAEIYDGNVSIVSKPGKGYSLNVVFPLNRN